MLNDEPKKSKFAPSSYSYKEKKPTLKEFIIVLIILLISGNLAYYVELGIDHNRIKPSLFGFIAMLFVGISIAIILEKIARSYLFNKKSNDLDMKDFTRHTSIHEQKSISKKLTPRGKEALKKYLEDVGVR